MAATNGAFWTQQFCKADGTPYVGVRVFHYVAGATTTNLDVYQNGDLTAPHNNPVVGDSTGRVSFYGNGTYRLQVRTSTADGNITLYDWDPVELVHHTATVRAEDKAISLPAASSAARGRIFGVVDGGGDVTSLWLQRTAAAWQQILTLPTLAQMLEFAKGSTIASTTNVTVPDDGNFFDVTGTNTIETLSGFNGYPIIYTRTLSALTFVHSANLVLQGAQNRTSLANQVTAWLHIGAGQWVELFYTNPLLGNSSLTDGAVLVGNAQAAITALALPTANRVLGHSGTTGQDPSWLTGLLYHGPTSIGTGSTRTHEGNTIISSDQNPFSGVHFYTNFTLNAGVTVTLPAASKRLIIVASDSITINGAITATGAGGTGGAGGSGAAVSNGAQGEHGTDQPGANGGIAFGASVGGGHVMSGGVFVAYGGGAQVTGSNSAIIANPMNAGGAAGGGGGGGDGGGNAGGAGGAGGGSIVLIAPSITLGSTAVLTTRGSDGSFGTANGGGGGGGGNVYIVTRSFTDNGATFTQTGGAAGGTGIGGVGSAGVNGVKQIVIYG